MESESDNPQNTDHQSDVDFSSSESSQSGPIDNLGAVILCGGKSSRLGFDKASLEFQGQTFLEHVTNRIREVTPHIVIVGGSNFERHRLPEVTLKRDEKKNCGPLEGIRAGLATLEPKVDYAFVTSCDVPLLMPELIRFIWDSKANAHAIVPFDGKRIYGMTAIYKTSLWMEIEARIETGQLRVSELSDAFNAKMLDVDALKKIDPNLDSMTNINSANDYSELLDRFGLAWPDGLKDILGFNS